MSSDGSTPVDGGLAVLAAVRALLEGTRAGFQAEQSGESVPEDAIASAAGGMALAMNRDWPQTAQYQSIALLSSTIRWLSQETGRGEEEILTELESNYRR